MNFDGRLRCLILNESSADAIYFEQRFKKSEHKLFAFERCTLQDLGAKRDSHSAQLALVYLDGYEISALEDIFKKLPTIVVSAPGDDESVLSAIAAGAQDFLVQGQFGAETFVRTARHVILQQRLERERTAIEEQFLASQKLESIGRLAGGVAHDFNNLLTVIINYSQMALNKLPAQDPMYKKIDAILQCGNRAAQLTRQLLAFSRQQVLKLQRMELNSVVMSIEPMLKRVIGEDIEQIFHLEPGLSEIQADPNQILQAIMNIVVNARDAMPNGGKLTIETSTVELDEPYSIKHVDVRPGKYAMLAVSDTGVGMDKNMIAHIFEPFFTTKEFGKGTGLGLSAVYGIVKQSGGHLWVYSEPGHGTVFKIYFPIVVKDEAVRANQNDSVRNESDKTILVVEDEEVVREVACEIIRKLGYQVVEASNAEDALKICEQGMGRIDLVLTDLVMPRMSGPELAKRLGEKHPQLGIIYMSGYSNETAEHHGITDKNAMFVQKPFMPKTLLFAIQQVLNAKSA